MPEAPKPDRPQPETPGADAALAALLEHLRPLQDTVGELGGSIRKFEQTLESVVALLTLLNELGGLERLKAAWMRGQNSKTPLERLERIVDVLAAIDAEKIRRWLSHPAVRALLADGSPDDDAAGEKGGKK
ncbi:hypothetical protein AB1399_12920 [Hydrogenibacillus schlegelii]|uniref:Uncharacterized protein n=1 Tax=Hydrogenibacillus schlegelii TaxID=1484 RepID=A0A132NCF3_HYDSH|nr:hypothetical protein [Hydrogenibacillus schlegelii]KWX07710.1 hypothetical protein TR75_02275 [Hydrogenibacillus schlegelii]OAR05536.1 hypothetical protein SA87_11685 [Hydrogenibacillus schlegelii]PTQ54015.1 MAG: hypothetical protein HSCHL_0869 [Hydrogenibacillus schlegelii]